MVRLRQGKGSNDDSFTVLYQHINYTNDQHPKTREKLDGKRSKTEESKQKDREIIKQSMTITYSIISRVIALDSGIIDSL